MVVCSASPGGRLRAAIAETEANFILCITEPRQALADLVISEGVPLATALRRVASSWAAIDSVVAMPGALPLIAENNCCAPSETVIAIARHLRIQLSDSELNEIARDHAKNPLVEGYVDAEAWWDSIRDAEREVVQGALAPYRSDGGIGESNSIQWHPELFSPANQPDAPLRGPIDITGLARPLLQGPNIRVSPGKWLVAISLAFSPEAIEHEFLVEIFGCEPPQRHIIRPSQIGRFDGTAEIMISDEEEAPLNVRLSNLRAAFDGTVMLVDAQLTPSMIGGIPPRTGMAELGGGRTPPYKSL
jgi:hypothetical protein